jgi:Flp pilus assembly protein TadD
VALGRTGRLPEAIREYETALALQPTNAITLNNLAWLLAAGADSTLRNGPRAVQLAEEASQISGGRAPQILKTLATAYAEAGRFDEAVATAQQALMLASVNNDVAYADSLRAELKLLQAKVPFHDGSLTNAPGK